MGSRDLTSIILSSDEIIAKLSRHASPFSSREEGG